MPNTPRPAFSITRRSALMGAAALPLAAATSSPAFAAAEMMGVAATRFNRVKLGDFEVTTLLSGTRTVPGPHGIFGLNASDEDFAAASKAANIPDDKAQFFFTPTVVNTGSELILFDTGLNPGLISGALQAAGYSTDQIDKVVLTHMHGDHIGGMADGGTATFANASYITGATEFDAWSKMENEGFEAKVRPFAENMSMIKGGDSVASGITAVEAFGHTPGHMAYMIESGGEQLMLAVDFANHYVWSLAHPDWEVKFDQDKAKAAETRRKMLDMIAAEKMPFVGYHMPWPGIGYVEKAGDGYTYVPTSYQMMLD
ncbi:MBL fold metallo-hydrolase [Rhodalgimonas zhirmunskyi]|uniref:MBL fold metallo-hydrolase n=1 Tax=Rhodalgimonas zhirmunskyi TaxID=2964767 RepID=A0AAJ1U4R3_9RHOB|nr:MBL fold metallo-hydrolase [Rhodoalgimonas zhirmunskyi]MDQ2093670.1 MBL fold metallo-hydrolase [Rhodoalgimonas zhirmunskyi]